MIGNVEPQSVTAAGEPLRQLPEGVVIRPGVTHVDERGAVFELYDPRWAVHDAPMVYAYISTMRPGWAKGWAVHDHHDDRYVLLTGRVELVLYDGRPDSATSGLEARLQLTDLHRCLVTVPAGVWHAERNIGEVETVIVNFPTTPYDHEAPDKRRLPLDNDELPVQLGPGWRGY